MSTFGAERETTEGFVRKVYTGVENFRVVAVNPTHEELKKLYNSENIKEEEYVGTSEIDGTEYPQVKIVLHLSNEAEKEEDRILTKATYWIVKKALQTKDDSGRMQAINLFGKTAWLTKEDIAAKKEMYAIVGANGTYNFEGDEVRPALRGEADFIDMLRNLLNLPAPGKVENKMEAASYFSAAEWNTIFSGNFKALKEVVKVTKNKVGFLLGARIVEDKIYQDVFTRASLRQWVKNTGKFDYFKRTFNNAIDNGAYPNTEWGNSNFALAEYSEDAVPTAKGGAFADGAAEDLFENENIFG